MLTILLPAKPLQNQIEIEIEIGIENWTLRVPNPKALTYFKTPQ